MGMNIGLFDVDLLKIWRKIYTNQFHRIAGKRKKADAELKRNYAFVKKMYSFRNDEIIMNQLGGVAGFEAMLANDAIRPPCTTCDLTDRMRYLSTAVKLFEDFEYFIHEYRTVRKASGLIQFLRTGTERQIAEVAHTCRFVKMNQGGDYSPGDIFAFDTKFAGSEKSYDIGIRIGTQNGILTELKSYSKCSVEGVCPVASSGTADEDYAGQKPISEKLQFQLTGQLGAYLSAQEATCNDALRYRFDIMKLVGNRSGFYGTKDDALVAIKKQFREVFMKAEKSRYLLFNFLVEKNLALLEYWVDRPFEASDEFYSDFAALVDSKENWSVVYDFIDVN